MDKYKNYALSAASFILQNLPEKWAGTLDAVILFGSVAQNRATTDSDVDLFFDVDLSTAQEKALRRLLNTIVEDFYLSAGALQFKLEGVDSRISVVVGKLDDWKDLKRGIVSAGIVLFGRYASGLEKSALRQHFIVAWEPPRKNRGAFLNKLYGYSVKKKHYRGMAEKYHCVRMGKSAVIVPGAHKTALVAHLAKYKVDYKIIEVFF